MGKIYAIVLSGGKGSRMNSDIPKQYLPIKGKPILYYSLKAFEDSKVDSVIVVASPSDFDMIQRDIISKYNLSKVCKLTEGGKERYHSVFAGLKAAKDADYVLIHDGARAMITPEIINRNIEAVKEYPACVTGMPSKDTVKIADDNGFVNTTPNRKSVWIIQTPQTFSYEVAMSAYSQMIESEGEIKSRGIEITDDAMVVETFGEMKVKLIEGDYKNIKITTPEDMILADRYL